MRRQKPSKHFHSGQFHQERSRPHPGLVRASPGTHRHPTLAPALPSGKLSRSQVRQMHHNHLTLHDLHPRLRSRGLARSSLYLHLPGEHRKTPATQKDTCGQPASFRGTPAALHKTRLRPRTLLPTLLLACAGIILVFPQIRDWHPTRQGLSFGIWKSLSLSISCQLFTAPLIWHTFGTLPKYFLLTNLLALPICGFLIPASVLTITASALGANPKALVKICEFSASLLTDTLKTIASIP